MIVVAIIGALATIAVPSMQEFRKRAYTAEAKTSLRSLMKASSAYYADTSVPTSSLKLIGWKPEGVPRYNVGFSSRISGPVGDPNHEPISWPYPLDTQALPAAGISVDTSLLQVGGLPITYTNFPPLSLSVNLNKVNTATGKYVSGPCAAGNLDRDLDLDVWCAVSHYDNIALMAFLLGPYEDGFFHYSED